ncbi:hypothetical protein [Microbulbifer taiwanensis]|uniref:Uncharacterized protein n=1 Tax=Microbulbifer taiwanensis TaxID=986746 RepID=A0ABW1YFX0_9GAMM|nr:hypothetical protein [Microbulbifer taiwanensis]
MNPINTATSAAKDNFDMKIAFSAFAGVAALGAVAYLLNKTGVKPLQTAANVAKKGSAK